ADNDIRDPLVTGVQTCPLPIFLEAGRQKPHRGRAQVRSRPPRPPRPPRPSPVGHEDPRRPTPAAAASLEPHAPRRGERLDLRAVGEQLLTEGVPLLFHLLAARETGACP